MGEFDDDILNGDSVDDDPNNIDDSIDNVASDVPDNEDPVGNTGSDVADNEGPVGNIGLDEVDDEDPVGNMTSDVSDNEDPVGNTGLDVADDEDPVGNITSDVSDNEDPVGNTGLDEVDDEDPVGNVASEVSDNEDPIDNTGLDVDDEEDPIRKVSLEGNYDSSTDTWTHPNSGDPRIDNPELISHPVARVSGGGSTVDGKYVTTDVINNPMTAQEELALSIFDQKDENGNVIGQTLNTATEITTGTVYTNSQNIIIGSDGLPTGQTFDPQIVEPQGVHPGGGVEIKLENPDDFVKEKTTINRDLDRDISWETYVAQEHKAETIAKIQQNKESYYSKRDNPLPPKPEDGGDADNIATISSNLTPEVENTAINQNIEVFGNAGIDPYANNPDSHFVPTDPNYLDPQSENTELTKLRAVRELKIFRNDQRD